jgi:hypothetical protein
MPTDNIKEKEIKTITDYGIIDDNGVYIPKEFLTDTGTLKNDPASTIAFDAYMTRYKKKYKNGKFVVYKDGFIKTLLENTKRNLKESKTPYEIKDELLSELKKASKYIDTTRFDTDKIKELKEVIDGWITVRQQHNLDIPQLKINQTSLKLA